MVESILIILIASFFVYIGLKYGRTPKPKEETVNADIKISFSVSDDGNLESTNYSINNHRLS